jgi:sulfide:quinone oxidoreductase
MNIKKISPNFLVTGQISVSDIGTIAASGIKTIIGNRPDNESEGQPAVSDIASAAEARGMTFLNVPVSSKVITDADVDDFERACSDAAGPVLAYCRTGMRSTILWALSQTKSKKIDEILSATAEAGYDLSRLQPRLMDRYRQSGEPSSGVTR